MCRVGAQCKHFHERNLSQEQGRGWVLLARHIKEWPFFVDTSQGIANGTDPGVCGPYQVTSGFHTSHRRQRQGLMGCCAVAKPGMVGKGYEQIWALEGNLATGARMLGLSLLDFLR